MKLFLVFIPALLLVAAAEAASDTDVTIIKAEKVVIEEDVITIVAEAKTSIIVLSGDYKADYKGATFMGRPMNQVTVKSDKATFVIRRPNSARPGGPVDKAWADTLQTARDLQQGKEVGRIGYYTPEVVIRKNLITSIDGPGFLYAKRR
jgi:hypothetical protein